MTRVNANVGGILVEITHWVCSPLTVAIAQRQRHELATLLKRISFYLLSVLLFMR